ncbi:carboxypeptidase-like regulatory domain-containing protein [Flavobacterium sp. Sd200]|uniref:DUF5686 and carboxypeptidase regulatory-like domain-containing protein n=1 Tax=Flavobacterium sp. Sd200 TaxID=2692211 RepID=UPI00136C5563|nr:DUF5686 and carboxypeptidase regulatory-like domain-containing protein [Flavobacterium sp. Sd200]MXN90782.1 carboxypeptidase-like regulatory domain-containing protein [Flavobacterium sp. Sd200]
MHKFLMALFVLSGLATQAQIKGKVTSDTAEGIPFVSISIENTYNNTTANEQGNYELNVKNTGKYIIVFQSIGFKTKKVPVTVNSFPYLLDVKLDDENYELNEVIISNAEDPAYAVIRQAIAHKKENSEKIGRFEADFYSKGLFRVKDVPKKIMGVKVEIPDGMVDSTGSGIIYLSETVSKITFEQPDNIKERIVASKISGNDRGFSYNTALGTFYNFYNNYVEYNINMISPLANNAFNYYKFKLEGTFFDENNNQINKIKLIPRRDKEPVFEGYIYIVDGSWAIYAIDVDIKGYRVQLPVMENMNLKQNFSYNSESRIWAKNSQIFDFKAGMFGIGFTGTFTHVYSNYIFHDRFDKKTFGKEVVFVEEGSNKKDTVYWNTMRPIPLTNEENADYIKKDSIQTLHTSKTYLDSVDKKNNRFKILDVLTGYSYRNSFKKSSFTYDGLLNIIGLSYNTVQGWSLNTGLSYNKYDEETGKSTYIGSKFNYGVAEDRLRVTGTISHRFNRRNYAYILLTGGSAVSQFNTAEPITPFINSVSTLFFKDNYMKLYDKTFIRAQYGQEVFTGLSMVGYAEYSRRKALFNNADWVFIKDDKDAYTSNNPLVPESDALPAFATHNLAKGGIIGTIKFGQKYITRPDGKMNVSSGSYPVLSFQYEKAFAGSEKNYEYDFIAARATYDVTLGNKGDFGINLKGGKFFNADGISFVDYKHFNGNQTHVGTSNAYLNVFNLMPYYTNSTNDSYLELHAEHNFKGYIMNKIPVLNLLQWNLVVGYHALGTPNNKPYQEFSAGFDNVGFGKFRFFRVDYVRAYQGSGFATHGVVFGLKFLNLL